MNQLTKAEEQLMQFLWEKRKAFTKDLIEAYSEPRPASTTVITLLKRMQEKGFVGFKEYGKSREYYPLVEKDNYFSKQVGEMIKGFFNDSAMQFASFFTEKTNLSEKELEDLRKIIDKQLQKKKK
jgi:BlaI family penicillinase repressor